MEKSTLKVTPVLGQIWAGERAQSNLVSSGGQESKLIQIKERKLLYNIYKSTKRTQADFKSETFRLSLPPACLSYQILLSDPKTFNNYVPVNFNRYENYFRNRDPNIYFYKFDTCSYMHQLGLLVSVPILF
jgi:hypothetical protein